MHPRFRYPAFPFLICAAIALLSFASSCWGQDFVISNGSQTVRGFNTDAGLLSVAHGPRLPDARIFPRLDMSISRRPFPGIRYSISVRPPVMFRCRRGHSNRITIVRTQEFEWYVDKEFFPGESGLPVFDSQGDATGIVLGNVLHRGVWLGRVGRVGTLPVFALPSPTLPSTGKALQASPAFPSSSASEADAESLDQ